MKKLLTLSILLLYTNAVLFAQQLPTISEKVKNMTRHEGFFDYYNDEKGDELWLEIKNLDQEFLYVNALTAAIGSNDIGLDRNQLGNTRIVKFQRLGSKILMIQPNYNFRAISDNPDERKAVEEAFAQSALWGFPIAAEESGRVLINLSSFLLRDAHGVTQRLASKNQGNYKLDDKRSGLYWQKMKNFPKNSEFEALLTFAGKRPGAWIRSVTPTAEAVTIRQHHSFVALPDDKFQTRIYDPRSGYYPLMYKDYATPISQPLVKRLIYRHRLIKKYPNQKVSEPLEPIIYYVDRGAPEPIRSALIEGASWWNEAFETAGFSNAFQVKLLPKDADPMDVRYNIINWVHRTTRGWSYGSTVSDPRTGEIIKGHVLLGSLRVRQDFLLAQGLLTAYPDGNTPDPRLQKMALARLRQLAAHEVGHTIGLTHNFAASVNNRSSVMDYPHPYIQLKNGQPDFSAAYGTGVGEWDIRAIMYGYQEFAKGEDVKKGLNEIIQENNKENLLFITDQDARPAGGAHPAAHLWDNGKDAIDELQRIIALRKYGIEHFSEKNIPVGAPMATLENVFTPLYLMHRYQVEAVSKIIGGNQYTYAMRGDGQQPNQILSRNEQEKALAVLLQTLSPRFLAIPDNILTIIPPQPLGYSRNRELFKNNTSMVFDPMAAAENSVSNTLRFLLNSERMTRLVNQQIRNPDALGPNDVMQAIHKATFPIDNPYRKMLQKVFINRLLELAADKNTSSAILGLIYLEINVLESLSDLVLSQGSSSEKRAHFQYLKTQITFFKNNPKNFVPIKMKKMPDGSPIGCGGM